MGVILGAVAVVGALYSANEQRKAQDEQRRAARKANALARKREKIRSFRQRVQAVRQQRKQVAEVQARGAASGVRTSSAQGAIAALGTSTASNISVANQLDLLAQQQSAALQEGRDEAAEHSQNAMIGGAVSSASTSAISAGFGVPGGVGA